MKLQKNEIIQKKIDRLPVVVVIVVTVAKYKNKYFFLLLVRYFLKFRVLEYFFISISSAYPFQNLQHHTLVELFFVFLDLHRPQDVSIALDFLAQETQAHEKNNINKILIKIYNFFSAKSNFFLREKRLFLRKITLKIIFFSTKFCFHAHEKCRTFLLKKLKFLMRMPKEVRLGHVI